MGEQQRVTVGIVGASGYGGVQLVRLLVDHPHLELVYLGGDSSAGQPFADLYPHLSHRIPQVIEPVDLEKIGDRCQIVFLALPNGLACNMAPTLIAKGCKVLDLGGLSLFGFRNLLLVVWRGTHGRGGGRNRCLRIAGTLSQPDC